MLFHDWCCFLKFRGGLLAFARSLCILFKNCFAEKYLTGFTHNGSSALAWYLTQVEELYKTFHDGFQTLSLEVILLGRMMVVPFNYLGYLL